MYTNRKKFVKGLFRVVLPLLLLGAIFASCMSSDKDSLPTGSNTCYVSNVSFSSFRKKFTTKASDGVTDSTYYSTYTAANWIFTIDHKTLMIENRDSLPFNTDLSRVTMNLSYVGGVALYRSSDAWEDDPWKPYSAEDSLDLRKPMHIKVRATDNTERQYTLCINVHTMESDSLHWAAVNSAEAINGEHPMKAIAWDKQMAVLSNNGSAVLWNTHTMSNLGEWNQQVTNLPLETEVSSLSKNADKLFVATTTGAIYSSADGISWDMLYQQDGLRLAGVSNDRLYTICSGELFSTSVNAIQWSKEGFDESASLFPSQDLTFLTYEQSDQLTRMILLGNRNETADTTSVVWSKCWTEFEGEENEGWMHYTRNWDNTSQLPMLTQMNLIHYDNMLMIFGGASRDGKVSALERIFVSRDNGLTWWRYQTILPPHDLKAAGGYLTVAVDESNFIWVIAGGKAYRGRVNRLGFLRPDIY